MTQSENAKSKAPGTQEKPKPTTPTQKSTKASESKRDKFGCTIGSQSAAIDAKLSTTPVTIEAIMAATKLTKARVQGHLRFLTKKKLVKETDKGFVATLK